MERVWGGRRLAAMRGENAGSGLPIGESWELADVGDHQSIVANGPLAGRTLRSVIEAAGRDLLGRLSLTADGEFPLLVKYLDAASALSVQVHPDDSGAAAIGGGCRSKSEAWYILEAEPGAVIYKGFRKVVTAEEVRAGIEAGTLVELLRAVPARAGDLHYIPAGTCHAIGAGVLLAEVQTPSDTTFRLFDWGRTDRTLHVDEALACLSLEPTDVRKQERRTHIAGFFTTVSKICTSDHFVIEKVRMVEEYEQEIPYDRPAVWIVLEGSARIFNTPAGVDVEVSGGEVVLIPAGMNEARVRLLKDTTWLDVQFPTLLAEELMA